MRSILLLLCVFSFPAVAIFDHPQSTFQGPVRLKVWRNSEPSWNVDLDSAFAPEFVLERGTSTMPMRNGGYLQLRFRKTVEEGLRARFKGTAYLPFGLYGTVAHPVDPMEVPGTVDDPEVVFRIETPYFLDEPGKRIITSIEFEVLRGDEVIYHYRILPMYVRGRESYYWKHAMPASLAHGGTGMITISNTSAAESGWETWDGQSVRPTLNFIDIAKLSYPGRVGLHRHERNQEVLWIVKGEALVLHAVSSRRSENYPIERILDEQGTRGVTDQFDAQGGWIESRKLTAGQYMVIVPTPDDSNKVTCHGILAQGYDVHFVIQGTKN